MLRHSRALAAAVLFAAPAFAQSAAPTVAQFLSPSSPLSLASAKKVDRVAWMAYEHNVQWVPHGWNTAIGLAADLQLSAAMPVAKYVEFLTPSPYVDELITVPFRPDAEGLLTIPDAPGLGVELNRDALKRFGV